MTLLIELAVKSTAVAGAALVLLAVLHRRSAAERSWVAHAALAVLAALPAAVILLPRWRLAPPTESAPALPALAAAPAPAVVDLSFWLQAAYAAGVALLLLATVVAVLRLVALRRGAAVLVDPDWLSALARAKARMKVRAGAALLVSTALTSPVSWGLVRPTIVVNQGLVASKGDAEAVIAHELAHVVRRDWAKLIGARIVTAIFWFNPLVWALARQCHQLREEAADDAVLGAEVSSADYANLLVEAARHQGRGLAAHGVAPGRGSLHRRVTRVLDAAARRTPTPAAWAMGVALGAALVAGPLAAVTLEPEEAAPAEAETTVTTPGPAATTATPATSAIVSRPAAVTVAGKPGGKQGGKASPAAAASTVGSIHAQAAAIETTADGGLILHNGKLTITDAGTAPRPAARKGALTVTGDSITFGDPDGAVTISGKTVTLRREADVSASSSASQTTTTNAKTNRGENLRADPADRLEDQRDRAHDERDRLEDEREARRDAERARTHAAADQARAAALDLRRRKELAINLALRRANDSGPDHSGMTPQTKAVAREIAQGDLRTRFKW